MRIDVGKVADASLESLHNTRRPIIAHLHDDQHGLRHQCPAAEGQPELLAGGKLAEYRIARAAAYRNTPTVFTSVHVDCDHAAKRRLQQGQAAGASKVAKLADVVVGPLPILGLAHRYDEGEPVGADVEHASIGVDRTA